LWIFSERAPLRAARGRRLLIWSNLTVLDAQSLKWGTRGMSRAKERPGQGKE